MLVLKNIGCLATFEGMSARTGSQMKEIVIRNNIDVLIDDGIIKEIGHGLFADNEIDCTQKTVLPGYVDSHTHFVYGGDRSEEYKMRLEGKSYVEIMEAGGGIQKTVKETRKASVQELVQSGRKRLDGMLSYGATTVESKSGYGLDLVTELKQLEAMDVLNEKHPIDLIKTFMGAHEIAPEFKGNARAYLDFILDEVMPKIDNVNYVDIFTEKNVFEIEESRYFLKRIKDLGYQIKIHADEIVPMDGSVLAGEIGAVSADHLLQISDAGMEALKQAGTVATLLPMTAFSIKADYARARDMIDSGLAVALASDYNPGSCHSYSIPLLIALATNYMRMTTPEVICALTLNGAAAVGKSAEIGSIEIGKKADFTIHDVMGIDAISYLFGVNTVEAVIKSGKLVYDKRRSYV